MIAVILAGGKGHRLWPESRQARPKQFSKIFDDQSMLDNSIDRLIRVGYQRIIIITDDSLLEATQALISRRPDSQLIEILSEPEAKNTAPAIGLALAKLGTAEDDTVLGIFPADHHIIEDPDFSNSLQNAALAAQQDFVVTIGIKPTRPETNYGYIEKDPHQILDLSNVYHVLTFREKPDQHTAEQYIKSGNYLWNSGIYISQVKTLREEFARYLPEIHCHIINGYEDYLNSYSNLPSISLDYGISEKSKIMAVVESDFGWYDLGNWEAFGTLIEKDAFNNSCIGENILVLESKECIVKQISKNIVLFGVDNMLVVETDDIILVTTREKGKDIRNLVNLIQKNGRQDLL